MRECKINYEVDGDLCVVHVYGALDSYSFATFESALNEIVGKDASRFILDCAGLEYISSVAIGALLGFARKATENGGQLLIAAMAPKVQHCVELLGFHRALNIHDTVDEARQGFTA